MNILITGGTGSFGNNFIKFLLEGEIYNKIVVYSRDEYKQDLMKKEFKSPRLRYFIGDIRDYDRLLMAMEGIDFVVHAAALKQVDTCEYNPEEVIKTNIDGCQNVINACINSNVTKCVFLSTDKAVSPVNLYGASKMVAEKLFIAANAYKFIFNVVRYGNIIDSRGSVFEIFKKIKNGEYPITSTEMTRFWVSYAQAIELVLNALVVPSALTLVVKAKKMYIMNIPYLFCKNPKLNEIGIRESEKLHEELMNEYEMKRAYEYESYYYITPEISYNDKVNYDTSKKVKPFVYRSDLVKDVEIKI